MSSDVYLTNFRTTQGQSLVTLVIADGLNGKDYVSVPVGLKHFQRSENRQCRWAGNRNYKLIQVG